MLMDLAWSCYIAGSIWGDDYLGGLAVLHHGIQGPIPHHKQDCRGSQPLCAFKSTSNNGVLCMIGVGAIVLNVPQPMTSHDHPSLPLSLSPSLSLSLRTPSRDSPMFCVRNFMTCTSDVHEFCGVELSVQQLGVELSTFQEAMEEEPALWGLQHCWFRGSKMGPWVLHDGCKCNTKLAYHFWIVS